MNRTHRNFTLIELLTVIAIIVILTGFLLPAVTKIKERTKVTRAQTDIRALQLAIKQYESTYGYLPAAAANPDAVKTTSTALKDILGGTGNVRKQVFLELQTGNLFKDPWGNDYQIALDTNYDGKVDNARIDASSTDVPGSVAIWTQDSEGDYITSWGN